MAAGNTYVAIAEQTLGSAAASVTFSSIPSTYTDLVLVIGSLTTSVGGNSFRCRINGDTATNYSYTELDGSGSSAASSRVSNGDYAKIAGFQVGTDTTTPQTIIAQFMNYSNTTTYKTFLSRFAGYVPTSGGEVDAVVLLWRSTAAINSIVVYPGGGNINAGTVVSLYGIKAA